MQNDVIDKKKYIDMQNDFACWQKSLIGKMVSLIGKMSSLIENRHWYAKYIDKQADVIDRTKTTLIG